MSDDPKAAPDAKDPPAPDANEAPEAHFDMDPTLAAALAEAGAYAEQKTGGRTSEAATAPPAKAGAPGAGEASLEGEEVPVEVASRPPVSGAGEDAVRAMAMEKLRQLKERVEVLEKEKKELEDRLLRAAADLENFKKRKAREAEQERKFANETVLRELLTVVDNLERAIAARETSSVEQYALGVEMVHKSLLDVLRRFGVERFSALGEAFDPSRMEAMRQVETDEHAPGEVVEEFLKGFLLHGRLLRPAMVTVAAASSRSAQATESAETSGEETAEAEAASPQAEAGAGAPGESTDGGSSEAGIGSDEGAGGPSEPDDGGSE